MTDPPVKTADQVLDEAKRALGILPDGKVDRSMRPSPMRIGNRHQRRAHAARKRRAHG